MGLAPHAGFVKANDFLSGLSSCKAGFVDPATKMKRDRSKNRTNQKAQSLLVHSHSKTKVIRIERGLVQLFKPHIENDACQSQLHRQAQGSFLSQ